MDIYNKKNSTSLLTIHIKIQKTAVGMSDLRISFVPSNGNENWYFETLIVLLNTHIQLLIVKTSHVATNLHRGH